MNTYEMVIASSKRMEGLLRHQLGATGNGLIELVRSVSSLLPEDLEGSLLHLGRIRNRLVHEEGFELSDPDGFQRQAEEAIEALERLSAGQPPRHVSSPVQPVEEHNTAGGSHHLQYLLFVTSGVTVAGLMMAGWTPALIFVPLMTLIAFFFCGMNTFREAFGLGVMFVVLLLYVVLGTAIAGAWGILLGLAVGCGMWYLSWVLAVMGPPAGPVLQKALRVARMGRFVMYPLLLGGVGLLFYTQAFMHTRRGSDVSIAGAVGLH